MNIKNSSNSSVWQEIVMMTHNFELSFKRVNNDYYKLYNYYGDEEVALDELEKYYIETIQKKTDDKESSNTIGSNS